MDPVSQTFRTFADLRSAVAPLPPVRAAIVEATEFNVLQGVIEAARAEIIEPILFGDATHVAEVVDLAPDAAAFAVRTTPNSATAAEVAVAVAADGEIDIVCKGHLHTGELLHPVLHQLRAGHRLSHVFIADLDTYPKLLLITDGAINISPTLAEKAEILTNAITLARLLGAEQPKVAVLSAIETINPDIPSTIDAACLAKMAERGQIPGAIVDGPLAFDVAISAQAAAIKGLESPVAGDVDIVLVLVPDLVAGNILAKDLAYLAGAVLAGVVLGTSVPIVLTSRSDPPAARLASFSVAALMHHASAARKRPPFTTISLWRNDMTDEQNAAEQLDDEVLGNEPDVDDLPGLNQYVEIGPMSAEDPTLLMGGADALDNDATRAWREEPEIDIDDSPVDERPVMSLLEATEPGSDQLDHEERLVGEAVRPADGHTGPEDAALHIEPDH